MIENEVIIVDSVPREIYQNIIRKSVEYAILSLPFTVDRMRIPNISRRIFNITKGKIAENLFLFFAKGNYLAVDEAPCLTPYYETDRRDFLLNGFEWDIKNNFIYHQGDIFRQNYTDLPALVPNRFSGDQWDKRNSRQIEQTKGVVFLFTFMKLSGSRSSSRVNFIDVFLTHKQTDYLQKLYRFYRGIPQEQKPFEETDFWRKMENLGNEKKYGLRINRLPSLIICGVAGAGEFKKFRDLSPQTFMNGTFRTRIKNRGVSISALPSFASGFPNLRQHLFHARFREMRDI